MLRNNRIILSKNGMLTDLSVNLSNYLSGTSVANIIAADDAIYVGSDMPFNHRWFEMSVVNDLSSVVSISLWNGGSWVSVVDIVDETQNTSGKTMSQSGVISWVPNRSNTGWINEYSTENVPALNSLRIYDTYWTRIQFSANVKSTMAFKFIGHKFSNDEDLFSQYPDLSNTVLMSAFSSGKTTWNDQHFIAAEYIIKDLREMGVIFSKNQILDWPQFKNASVHKVAEIIYASFGKDYTDAKKQSHEDYKSNLQLKAYNVDLNQNARLDQKETMKISGYFVR